MRNKFKPILILLLALLLMCGPLSIAAHAETTGVTYEGESQKFIFLPESTDLFQGFKGVMPGDELSQDISVSNKGKNKVKIYLRAEVPDDTNKDFLDQMKLVVYGLKGEKIFEDASGKTGSLTEGYALGTIGSGENGKLVAKLQVPPEMDNAFQQQLGRISWIFSVEELEDAAVKPVNTGDDTSNIWIGIAAMAALAGIVLVITRKTRGNH